jgi:hypothetical protein
VEKPNPTKKIKVEEGDWQEKKPHGNRKSNGFCLDCLALETCIKEKHAMIMFCGDKRVA